ncbi:MAG TPA: acyl-CoA dehydrogenase family protein, partial [Kineosporiaceae bacterium]|nr:acyl-CoA dehydrogenase family protein [Kineosporiaceae bacterium]
MDFTLDARTTQLQAAMTAFLTEHVYPAEAVLAEQSRELESNPATFWDTPPIVEKLKAEARSRGLWNLFLPGEHGAGLTNLQYAPLAEISGRSPVLAPEAINCSAPDTGNMEVLAMFGTAEQKERWLAPLLEGQIRSAFCMTEPDVASSDATNIEARIERDGDEYVVTGRKWWSSGAMNPNCRIFIVMGKTDPSAPRHRQQSMILVPRDTPGVSVIRGLNVFGFTDAGHGGHAEVVF